MKKILIGFGALVFILIIVLLFVLVKGEKKPKKITLPKEPVTLTYWRLFDEEDVFKPFLDEYKSLRKNVTIKYVKKDYATYEADLLDALAAGKGPDIFVLRNDMFPKDLDKLIACPEVILTADVFKKAMVPVASQDLVFEERIYGIPLWVDSLALYYNPKLFEEALERESQAIKPEDREKKKRIQSLLQKPPTNWTDFLETVKLLTKKDDKGNITQAGVAFGTSTNVQKAADILSLLMIQNNTQMTTADQKSATFNLPIKKTTGESIYPGTEALKFYTSFARDNTEVYAYNESFPDSMQAFGEGKVAIMSHYSYLLPLLKTRYPELKFEVAPMPQIKNVEKPVNYAYYFAETVSKHSKYPEVAWDFLKFIASKNRIKQYNRTTKRPYSRIEFAQEEMGEGGFSVFSKQAETATSWYKRDPQKIDEVFKNMINVVLKENQPFQTAIDAASASATNILQQGEPLFEKEEVLP